MMCSWICVALIGGFTPVEAIFKFPIFWPTAPPFPTRPPLTLTPRIRTREPITQGPYYTDDIDLRSSTPGIIDGTDVSSTVSPDLTSTFPGRGYPPIETSGSGLPEGSGEESGDILGILGIRESSGEASGIPEAFGEFSGTPETSGESSGIPEISGESSGAPDLLE
ncbi:unnamed protein product, partial [Cylicostephanus goldi]